MQLTGVYGAILALIFMILSVRVISIRWSKKIAIGSGGNADLERAIRSHANFVEYVPLALILMLFVERPDTEVAIHISGVTLIIARCTHVYGMVAKDFRSRAIGVGATCCIVIALSLTLLLRQIL